MFSAAKLLPMSPALPPSAATRSRRQFNCQGPVHAQNAGLGGTIDRQLRPAALARLGRHVDHHAVTLVVHNLGKGLGAQEHTLEVDRQ
jgi:hypothetical protein